MVTKSLRKNTFCCIVTRTRCSSIRGNICPTNELSGKLSTQEEFSSALGVVWGKEVSNQQVDDTTYTDIMKRAGLLDFLIHVNSIIELNLNRLTFNRKVGFLKKYMNHAT